MVTASESSADMRKNFESVIIKQQSSKSETKSTYDKALAIKLYKKAWELKIPKDEYVQFIEKEYKKC